MKQKELSILLRAIVVLAGLVWLFIAYVFGKSLALCFIEPDRILTPVALICLMLLPAALAIFDAWNIFTDIGRNRSFTKENARRLKRISHCALIDTVLDLILTVYTFINNMSRRMVWDPLITAERLASGFDQLILLFLLIAIAGVAATIGTAALSNLTLKAAQLQDENDLTI